MTASPSNAFRSAILLLLCAATTSSAVAQTTTKQPLFNHRPYMCIGSGFVALVPSGDPPGLTTLMVIKIGSKGIEEPQKFTLKDSTFFGLQCMGYHIELLVTQKGSDHFSVLPFRIWHNVEPEEREDIDWSARNGPVPSKIERRTDGFHQTGRAGDNMRGDWYVEVNASEGRPYHRYEVHFVETEFESKDAVAIKLVVTLLEETLGRKVSQSVPLINEEVTEVYD